MRKAAVKSALPMRRRRKPSGRSSGRKVNRIVSDPTALPKVMSPAWKAENPKPSCSRRASRKTDEVVLK
jgi:hypothetical protein